MSQDPENTAVAAEPFGNAGKDHARGGAREIAATVTGGGREDLFAEFRDYLRALKRAPATLSGYTLGLSRFFAWLDGRGFADLRAVRRDDIQAWQAELMASGRYTTNSVHVLLRSVRRFYDYLDRAGKVLVNPTLGMPFPKLEDRLPRAVLTPGEMRRLLNAPDTSRLDGIRDKAMLELLYSAGLRLAELCALTVYDVDVHGGYVRVNSGKGAKDRVVPMGHKATQYVKEYLRHVRGRLTEKRRDERALFVGVMGKRINPIIVERLIRDYARTAGLSKRVTPHTFRHTCATHLLADGADVVHVQRLLGHACIDTTQIYTRVAERDVKKTHGKTHPREHDAESVPDAKPKTFKTPWGTYSHGRRRTR